jgi:hypothetical protein
MTQKLRTLLGGFLLAACLTLNAHAFTDSADIAGANAPQQSSGLCWVYFMGRWIQIPC